MFILDCIKSVQAQTFINWEMLIVNDGSPDCTSEIVSNYILTDPRIKLFNRDNVGIFRLSETYNFALSHSKGNYIAILEGDDVWENDKLERQIKAMEGYKSIVLSWGPVAAVSSDLLHVIDPPYKPSEIEKKYFSNNPLGSILNLLLFKNVIPALSLLIRKSTLEQIGGFKQGYGLPLVDIPTLLELSTMGHFFYDPKPVGKWRLYPNQITKTYPAEIIDGIYNLVTDKYKEYKHKPELNFNIDEPSLHRFYKRNIIMAYSRAGRYCLVRQDFKGARRIYLKSLFKFGFIEPLWKLRSLTGLLFSFMHLNVEGLAKLLGNTYYKQNQ